MAGLSERYDDVQTEVRSAVSLWATLHRRAFPVSTRVLMPWVPSEVWQYLPKRPDAYRERLKRRARKEDRDNRLFPIATAVYFIDALADHVRGSFELTPQDANALLTLHAERSHEEEAFAAFVRLHWLLPAGLLAGAILAAPKEAFEVVGVGGRTYAWYRFGLAIALLVLAVVALVARFRVRRDALHTRHVMGLVLRVCAINDLREPRPSAPNNVGE